MQAQILCRSSRADSSNNDMPETDAFMFLRTSRTTLAKQSITAIRRIDGLVYCYIITILLCYITLDMYTRQNPSRIPAKYLLDKRCGSIEGHLPANTTANPTPEDPWQHMKWTGKPAQCRVKGHQIESLDPTNNFRRGYALKYTSDVEDKTHILPWLLGNQRNLNTSPRRVLLDLGGNRFDTSITWFMRMYPCDFTEVHVFEIDANLFKFPAEPYNETLNVRPGTASDATVVQNTPGIPHWMIRRMKLYNAFVSDGDDASKSAVNITRFVKETLELAAPDVVVVKMDIEGSEWPILERWMDDSEMAAIVDELFVEIHYGDESMAAFWGGPGGQFGAHTRWDALRLLAGLRAKGFFVHAWP